MPHDRAVWITGASAGIGRAVLAAIPFPALAVAVSRSGAADVTLPEGVDLLDVHADLADPAGWDAVVASFDEHLTPELSEVVLVHAAGAVAVGYAGEADSSDYRAAVLLNTASPVVLGEAFLAAADEAGVPAQALLLTSGPSVYEGWSAYKSGKAEMDAWVRAAGHRPGASRVVAIAPGLVETGMQHTLRAIDPEQFPAKDKFVAAHEGGDVRDPDDVAADLWRVLQGDRPPTGSVIDLRELA
jgi:benzil reductase ((S)-benzoin forming)